MEKELVLPKKVPAVSTLVTHCYFSVACICFRAVHIEFPRALDHGDGTWVLSVPCMVHKYARGSLELLWNFHLNSLELLQLSWLRETTTLLEILGSTRKIQQKTNLHFA